VLITGAGLYAVVVPPPEGSRVALYYLHSDIWWGAFMALVRLFYCTRYNPFRDARQAFACPAESRSWRSSTSWAAIVVGVTDGATAVAGAGQAMPSPRPEMNPAARQSFD